MLEIYRSSRIEMLADLLAEHLRQQRPASVLSPQRLIVGHLGMKRWLTQRLASGCGARIAANLEMLLPSEWLDRLAQGVLGRHSIAIAPYRRPALRWRIHALLAQLDEPQVADYLAGDDAPRRHFQLADRLAGLFGQYLVYRRDWLAAWERGADAGVAHWQNRLWRQVVEGIGLDHRGRRMGDLAALLPALAPDPEEPALHVFGVSHLPPDALAALDALSHSRTVQVYFPDPCRELWQDLVNQRAHYAASLKGEAFVEIGHPLLASLGRMGQHFTLLLNSLDAGCDLRHQDDEQAQGRLPARHSLLERVQHSIRTLRPDWVRRPDDDRRDPRSDTSLRAHACHTRLRELEVLKDALLEQLARDPDLAPRDIVVMAPNMALYATLLPVVFGEAGKASALLPYQLADVALARMHPLLGAVRELIDLPTQRIARSQVLSLLALPAVARRFGIGESEHAALARWLARTHVAWGLDGTMKADFGAAPVADHSFAFGFDRMFAGYLLGEVPPDCVLGTDILPADPVSGPDVACLGALWGLIEVLREWRDGLARPRTLEAWSLQLREWLERLFVVDPADDGEREALAAVIKLAAGMADEQRDAGIAPLLEWSVVREVLKQGLDGVPERQPFLAGGITFCGMVPQRAIPFKVIALLGLNDGEYPRPRPDTGLDLMQSHPRLGDRDNRSDDRYLFLEALMSARQALHLSYLGEGPQDGKPRNPALPLAELLGFLDREHALAPGAPDYDPPWRVRHALQPFDARYFDPAQPDPRRYSYSDEFARLQADGPASDWRLLTDRAPLAAPGGSEGTIELKSMARFFRDPASWICRQSLRLSRAALEDEAASDTEPLSPRIHPFDGIRLELVWQALVAGQAALPATPPPAFRLSGRYPSGALGVRAWQRVREEAQAWLDLARAQAPFGHGAPQPLAQAVDLLLGELRLVGQIDHLYQQGDTLWLVSLVSSQPSFRQLLPLFIDWAALNLMQPARPCRILAMHADKDDLPALGPAIAFTDDREQLAAGLAVLANLYRDAPQVAGAYFARSSYALAAVLGEQPDAIDKAWQAASSAWHGSSFGGGRGEREYAPHYNRLVAGDDAFLRPDSSQHARFQAIATTLLQLMTGTLPAAENAA